MMAMTDEVAMPNREQRRAAGYRGGKKIYKLTFEDQDMAVDDGVELVIRARAVSFRKLLDLAKIDTSILGQHVTELSEEDVEMLIGLLTDFAGCIVEWNLTDDEGQPVPTTVDGLLDQDPAWVLRVFMAWFQSIASVPSPLGARLPNGPQFPGGSGTMAPPSQSPLS